MPSFAPLSDAPLSDNGTPSISVTPLLVDALNREVLGNAAAIAYADALTRETLAIGTGMIHADSVIRETVGRGIGIIHSDGVVREVAANGTGFIYADSIVRELLLVPKVAAFANALVREILTNGPNSYYVDVSDGGADPRDSIGGQNTYAYSLTEHANARDTFRVVPGRRRKRGYDPLPQNHPDPAVRAIQEKVNAVLEGRVNTTFIDVSLNADSETTTIVDNRIGPQSAITLSAIWPTIPEPISFECQKGQVILHHSNTDDTTRRYIVNIIAA